MRCAAQHPSKNDRRTIRLASVHSVLCRDAVARELGRKEVNFPKFGEDRAQPRASKAAARKTQAAGGRRSGEERDKDDSDSSGSDSDSGKGVRSGGGGGDDDDGEGGGYGGHEEGSGAEEVAVRPRRDRGDDGVPMDQPSLLVRADKAWRVSHLPASIPPYLHLPTTTQPLRYRVGGPVDRMNSVQGC